MDIITTIIHEHAVIQGINDAMYGPFVTNSQEEAAPSDALKKILVPIQLDALCVRSGNQTYAEVQWKNKPVPDNIDPSPTKEIPRKPKAW